ncbi:ATP synthase F1 subunit epsilon [soil metagenome]
MSEKSINLSIVSPEKIVYSGEVNSVTAPGELGYFQILYNHAALISTLGTGQLKIITNSNETLLYAVSGGVFEVKNNKAILLADSIESKEDIDTERAEQSLLRAKELLGSTEVKIKEEAKKNIITEKNKIKVSGK